MRCQRALLAALMLAMLVGVQPATAAPRSENLRESSPSLLSAGLPAIRTIFLIMMENHNWSDIHGSTSAPYINSLLPLSAHAEQYFNPPGIHPSEPNYLWLEAGTNFGILNDAEPAVNHQSTTQHLTSLLTSAGVSWKTYQESIDGTNCPLTSGGTDGKYAARHNPFVYFDDVTNTNSPASANCIAHNRPFPELATDLASNTLARYNFITPNVCDDMHDSTGCATLDSIKNGDTWLSQNVPTILNSAAYRNNGALFITWDEGEGGSDGPLGMIALSPLAKQGYANTLAYTHSSTLRTLEEFFGVTPLLGDAANATNLSDFFQSPAPLPPRRPTGPLNPLPALPLPPTRPSPAPNVGTPNLLPPARR
ncbi:MAG: alkaline phosphatase family protein [Chloroflexota bacterium]|nr:alkaline phosphatase family protein [Chloroflexota bacterium]MDQ6907749.1 alkaline phosphatase family protein [Chloroflexota bacterium]